MYRVHFKEEDRSLRHELVIKIVLTGTDDAWIFGRVGCSSQNKRVRYYKDALVDVDLTPKTIYQDLRKLVYWVRRKLLLWSYQAHHSLWNFQPPSRRTAKAG